MKKLILCMVAVLGLGIAASAANYTIDEQSIDAMIEMAEEVSPAALEAQGASDVTIHLGNGAQPIVAWILSFIPVTGWLAIHRMYMGTSILAVLLNIVTGAGFGIVYVVDWIVLLIGVLDNNIGKYCNNGRWLMWADII
ncbi:MAG: TM2 domain-containing protein [Bacteroidales bacterium]|nr:TM2 domain-containing protein [Bacteroidales bacterium]